jgi:hypothetical protein
LKLENGGGNKNILKKTLTKITRFWGWDEIETILKLCAVSSFLLCHVDSSCCSGGLPPLSCWQLLFQWRAVGHVPVEEVSSCGLWIMCTKHKHYADILPVFPSACILSIFQNYVSFVKLYSKFLQVNLIVGLCQYNTSTRLQMLFRSQFNI